MTIENAQTVVSSFSKGAQHTATGTCTSGVVTGGGARLLFADSGDDEQAIVSESYPSSTTAWTVVSTILSSSWDGNLTVRAYAICGPQPGQFLESAVGVAVSDTTQPDLITEGNAMTSKSRSVEIPGMETRRNVLRLAVSRVMGDEDGRAVRDFAEFVDKVSNCALRFTSKEGSPLTAVEYVTLRARPKRRDRCSGAHSGFSA